MKMHDAHGIPRDARCKMHMAYATDQPTNSPIHTLKFGFYPREGRYAVQLTVPIGDDGQLMSGTPPVL